MPGATVSRDACVKLSPSCGFGINDLTTMQSASRTDVVGVRSEDPLLCTEWSRTFEDQIDDFEIHFMGPDAHDNDWSGSDTLFLVYFGLNDMVSSLTFSLRRLIANQLLATQHQTAVCLSFVFRV